MRSRLPMALLIAIITSSLVLSGAQAYNPATPAFARTWDRTDRLVHGVIRRTWIWGPEANTGAVIENYAEAPGGRRVVQYFDKSRMEDNSWRASDSPWDVTNGLLVVELITGRLQLGDASFEQRAPAEVNVAGDPNDPEGPTYVTFSTLLSLPPASLETLLIQRVDRNGTVTDDPSLASQNIAVGFVDEVTNHAIASPFWEFMHSTGLVLTEEGVREDKLFENPFFATGRPVSEAYWAEVLVAGTKQLVLIQCFERRCLTYTPANEPGWRVEAGNVGLHYMNWRYPEGIPVEDAFVVVADTWNNRIQKFDTAGAYIAEWGRQDAGLWEVTNAPRSIAIGRDGAVYVADTGNHRIQKGNSSGTYRGHWGEQGKKPGQFESPGGVALDADGHLYVADTGNHRIQKFDGNGNVLTQWGSLGAAAGQFIHPSGIAVSPDGSIYVADSGNDRIQKFDAGGTFLAQWGGRGGNAGQFQFPEGIAIDRAGNVYVADTYNNRVQRFASTGSYLGQWGSEGGADGQFLTPGGIAVDEMTGDVYVADTGNHRIQRFDSDGVQLARWDGQGNRPGQFRTPRGISTDERGKVYVVDTANDRIQKFDRAGTYLDQWGSDYFGNGQMFQPADVAIDAAGNVYVPDPVNDRIQKFHHSGVFLAQWSVRDTPDRVFGFPWGPFGIAVSRDGTVYVTGQYWVQKFDSNGRYLGQWGSPSPEGGLFQFFGGIAIDHAGNVYVVDSYNYRIQKFDEDGAFLLEWGSPGVNSGQFDHPTAVDVDDEGNVYVADTYNQRIQKFDSNGNFLSQWGEGFGDGDGQFQSPQGLAVNGGNRVYVVDRNTSRIQVFDSAGVYLTQWGEFGNGIGQLDGPSGIAILDERPQAAASSGAADSSRANH